MSRLGEQVDGTTTVLKRGESESPGAGSPIYDELVAEHGDPSTWPPTAVAATEANGSSKRGVGTNGARLA